MEAQAPADEQHRALREGCGVLDRSERGKLALTGAGAAEFLDGQVTNAIAELAPGTGCYAAFLTPKGKMLGDLRILVLERAPAGLATPEGGGELWLDTERFALQALFDLVRRFKLGYDVELHKRTLEHGLVSLIGPRAREVAGVPELPSTEHSHLAGSVAGCPALLVATDLGVDVLCAAADTPSVLGALRRDGAVPVSEAAADVLRIAAGRPRYGVDIDDTTIPQEAGLNERAVSFTKGCYVGQETVARLHWRGRPTRHLRGLELTGEATTGDELRLGDRVVGRLGSVALGPGGRTIALALLRREAEPGTIVAVGAGGATARVSELPFARPL